MQVQHGQLTQMDWAQMVFLIHFYSIYFTDANNGYIPGRWMEINIYKTTNAGSNMDNNTDRIIGDFNFNLFSGCNTGYVVGGPGNIIKTTNSGMNWDQLSSGEIREFLYSVYFPDASTGYAVGDALEWF
jgi:photosystem II stability/assembly factor-like uncharacterized protein